MWIDSERLRERSRSNFRLKRVLDRVMSLELICGSKYDYHLYLQSHKKSKRKITINEEEASKSNFYVKNPKFEGK